MRSSRPLLKAVLRTTAKRGHASHENEDHAAENPAKGRFSVSDGASTSARSDVWSRLLTDAFVQGQDPLDPHVLGDLRRQWWDLVFDDKLPWYAHEKLARGSAATFVGLRVDGDVYEATAVGDSCLFHIRKDELVLAAPYDHWTQFSRFPPLVMTNHAVPQLHEHRWSGEGHLLEGDVLVLATDAVAKHLLRVHAEDGTFPVLDHITDHASFAAFVEHQRDHRLDNDDSTVCVVWT